MVLEKFGPHGMTGYEVTTLTGTPDGKTPAPHSVCATLHFNKIEEFHASLAAEAGPVLGDIPNFSDQNPVIMTGEVEAKVSRASDSAPPI